MNFQLTTEQEKTISHLESVEKAYLELLQRSEQMKIGIGNYKASHFISSHRRAALFVVNSSHQQSLISVVGSHQRFSNLLLVLISNSNVLFSSATLKCVAGSHQQLRNLLLIQTLKYVLGSHQLFVVSCIELLWTPCYLLS